jgi:hypothetical protein
LAFVDQQEFFLNDFDDERADDSGGRAGGEKLGPAKFQAGNLFLRLIRIQYSEKRALLLLGFKRSYNE